MSKKIFVFIVEVIVCILVYSFVISQIRSRMVLLDVQLTELEENYKILKNETDSIMESIGQLLSMNNLNKVAVEKNLKRPTKEQIVELTNDKIEAKKN
jgi:cell division protein FtsL